MNKINFPSETKDSKNKQQISHFNILVAPNNKKEKESIKDFCAGLRYSQQQQKVNVTSDKETRKNAKHKKYVKYTNKNSMTCLMRMKIIVDSTFLPLSEKILIGLHGICNLSQKTPKYIPAFFFIMVVVKTTASKQNLSA